jgi:hypothetical protein
MPFLRVRRLLLRHEARELPDIDRKAPEPVAEGLGVLPREQRRGRDDGHLQALRSGHKSRAHGDLGLAETHVAHHQPVHGPPAFEVLQHIGDGRELIVRLLVGEARVERLPHVAGRFEDRGGTQFPLCGDADELVGDLPDAFLEPRLLGLPCAAAETVEQPLLRGHIG